MTDQLKLPPSINSPVIKDASGRCWKITGFSSNTTNITRIDDDLLIQENLPCCDNCDTFPSLEEVIEEDIPDSAFITIPEPGFYQCGCCCQPS